jgi:PhzF family phenazine biosynthesis protein
MSRRSRSFTQVDVFTDEPLLGNPVAVVLDAEGLGTENMQRFTSWTNLSEATFLAPPTHPEADYSVRIFTGAGELPFAGHPTLGSCFAWLAAGGVPKGDVVVQECGAGLVPVHHDPLTGQLQFAAPPRLRTGPLDDSDVELIARGLALGRSEIADHQWCDNGPPWQVVLLGSAEQVLAVRPDPALLDGRMVGVVGPHPAGSQAQFEVRAFFPTSQGLGEDPVTGSLNAALGQWLIETGKAPHRYVVAQGTALGRAGWVRIEQTGDDVWVGGHCVQVLAGTATL